MAKPAYILTGPTSGYGRATASELAKHGTVILVGRDGSKLKTLERKLGGDCVSVVADLSDLESVGRAAAELVRLGLPIAGVVNNAGVMAMRSRTSAQGWDVTFATNHLGTFALIEALVPHLPDGANVVVLASAVEDPDRKQAKLAGFRGGRFVSIEASARGEWRAGGSKLAGGDAYATSKQCILAATLALARETPRVRFNAIEPGFSAATGLGRDANVFLRVLGKLVFALVGPLIKGSTTPKRAARVVTNVVLDPAATGIYFDERGAPMTPSEVARDPAFQDKVLAETRDFLLARFARPSWAGRVA
jgi:NAD(P)-dependent dehydrogenase (short-subunit alcohol dehydrogenase family)